MRYGYSLPLGQFASHEYNEGAYALLGSNSSVEGAYYFAKGLGIGLSISASAYPVATGFYMQDKDSADIDFTYTNLKSSPYYLRTFGTGIYYRHRLNNRFYTNIKGLGGVCWALSPDQLYVAKSDLKGVIAWTKTSSRSIQFTYLLGIGLNYKLFDHVDLMLEAEYSYAKSVFGFVDLANHHTTQTIKMPLFKLQPGINITF